MKKRHMWYYPGVFIVVFGGWAALLVGADSGNRQRDPVALVNGSDITRADYEREMNQTQRRIQAQGRQVSESQLKELKKVVLDNVIGRELLYQESQKQGILVKTSDTEAGFSSMKNSYPNETEFRNSLAEMNFSEESVRT